MNEISSKRYLALLAIEESGRLDFEKARSLLNVSPPTLKRYLSALVREGYLERREDGYYATSLGLKLASTIKSMAERKEVSKYIVTDPSTGAPIPLSFSSYKQLLAIIEAGLAPREVLESHFQKYLLQWAKNAAGDVLLEELVNRGIVKSLDDLRKYLEAMIAIQEEISQG